MSYKDIAIKILESTGKPLSIKDIVSKLPSESSRGKNPEKLIASLATALYRDVKRGKLSQLILVNRGTFGLRRWIYPNEKIAVVKNRKYKSDSIKLFSWKKNNKSIVAYYRREDPYQHNCPLSHFKYICLQIYYFIESEKPEINSADLFNVLKGKNLSDNHTFNSKRETYKINMVFNILQLETLFKKNISGKGFILAVNPNDFLDWINNLDN